jgi:hypothetical protein
MDYYIKIGMVEEIPEEKWATDEDILDFVNLCIDKGYSRKVKNVFTQTSLMIDLDLYKESKNEKI